MFFLHAVQLKLQEKSVEENKNSYEYKVLVKFFKKLGSSHKNKNILSVLIHWTKVPSVHPVWCIDKILK